jgi:hypothetical protein
MPTLKVYALLLLLAALYLGSAVPTIPAGFQLFAGLLAAALFGEAIALWVRWRWSGILYLLIFGVMAAWAAGQVIARGPSASQLLYLFATLVALSGYGPIQTALGKR